MTAAPGRTVVFDVGGTWFRSAVWCGAGALVGRSRRPAIAFHHHPDRDVATLQRDLVDWLVAETVRLRREHDAEPRAAISMGAALNAHDGFVHGSGPLWGPAGRPLDLLAELRRAAPDVAWTILNDVTAALLRHVAEQGPRGDGRTMLVTISSGIACRVFDHRRRCVPVEPRHGLQGEIGHLPVRCVFGGRQVEAVCDCGGANHLNAFASGRGLDALLAHVLALPDGGGSASSSLARDADGAAPTVPRLLAAARAGDGWSRSLVSAAFEPLANVLRVQFAHDPELDPVLFVGGVAAALGDQLVAILCEHLERDGLYGISSREPDWFRRRLCLGRLDDDSGLLGCGIAASAPAAGALA